MEGVQLHLLANDGIRRRERVGWDGLKEDHLASLIRQARRVLDGQSYLPFRRCTPVEVGRHRATGLNWGRPVAKVPDVRNDRSAARTPVAVEGDHVARWDAGNARLVGKSGEEIGSSVCLYRRPYSSNEYRDCKKDSMISQGKTPILSPSLTEA